MKVLQNAVARSVYRLSFGAGGRTLVTAGSGGFDIWDLTSEGHTHIPRPDVTSYVLVCECDPLGRWFYVSDSSALGGRVIPFSGQGHTALPSPRGHHHVYSLAISPNGARLLLSRGSQLECWATARGWQAAWGIRDGKRVDPLAEFRAHPGWAFHTVALSQDGRMVATSEYRSSSAGPVVALRDGASGELLRDLGPAGDPFTYRLTFTPDGKTLLGWGEREITLWEVESSSQVGQLSPGRSKLQGLAVHPSGHFLLAVSGDRTARTWDLATLRQTQALKWAIGKLSSLALSPDGTLAAAGGEKGQVVLWDID